MALKNDLYKRQERGGAELTKGGCTMNRVSALLIWVKIQKNLANFSESSTSVDVLLNVETSCSSSIVSWRHSARPRWCETRICSNLGLFKLMCEKAELSAGQLDAVMIKLSFQNSTLCIIERRLAELKHFPANYERLL